MSAEIIKLSDYVQQQDENIEIDLFTAVDAAIRDLKEIRQAWGSPDAYARAVECEAMLRRAFASS